MSSDPDELRSMIRAGRRQAVTARISATSPWTGTHIVASYSGRTTAAGHAGHLYTTRRCGRCRG